MNKPLSLNVLLKRHGYMMPLSEVLSLLRTHGIITRSDDLDRPHDTLNALYSSYGDSSRTRTGVLTFYPESFDELMQIIGVE